MGGSNGVETWHQYATPGELLDHLAGQTPDPPTYPPASKLGFVYGKRTLQATAVEEMLHP